MQAETLSAEEIALAVFKCAFHPADVATADLIERRKQDFLPTWEHAQECAKAVLSLLSSASVSGVGGGSARAVPLLAEGAWKLAQVSPPFAVIEPVFERTRYDAGYCTHLELATAIIKAAPTPPNEVLERMARAFLTTYGGRMHRQQVVVDRAKDALRAALAAAETSPPADGRRVAPETSPEPKP